MEIDDKNYELSEKTPLELALNVHGLLAVKKDGSAGAVGLEEIANEAGKKVGDAVKIVGNVLPTDATVNKTAKVFGGTAGKTLTFTGGSVVIKPNYESNLIFDAVTKLWSIQDEVEQIKGLNGKTTENFNYAKPGGYLAGDQVYYSGNKIYSALVNVPMGESPATNPTKWKIELDAGESFTKKTRTENYINEDILKDGYYNASGVFQSTTSSKTGCKIPVSVGDKLYSFFTGSGLETTQGFDSVMWGASGNFLGKLSLSAEYTVTRSDVAFIEPVFYPAPSFDTPFKRMVLKNRELKTVYEYLPYYNLTVNSTEDNKVIDKKIYSGFLNRLRIGRDGGIFFINGIINSQNGVSAGGSGAASSWYIPVEYGKTYVTNANLSIVYYGATFKSDGTYNSSLASMQVAINKGTILINDPNVKFIRVTFTGLSPWDTIFFGEGYYLPLDLKTQELQAIFKYSDYERLKEIATPLRGKKLAAVGDSNTTGYSTIPATSYVRMLKERYDIDTYNHGIVGSRIAAQGEAGQVNYDKSMVVRALALPNTFDILILNGGINDAGNKLPVGNMDSRDYFTFYGALHTIAKDWITRFLGKKILWMTPPNLYKGNPYHDAIIEVANYYGIPVFDFSSKCYASKRVSDEVTALLFPDGLHLSNLAHEMETPLIYQELLHA